MPTTADYLNDLTAQKDSLAETLQSVGVEASTDETFSTLVPKNNEKIRELASAAVAVNKGEDSLVMRNSTEYSNDRVTTIGAFAFYIYSELKSINFPNVTYAGTDAFYGCNALTNVNFPKLLTMSSYLFRNCRSLVEITLPSVKSVNGFRGCTKLEKLDISSAEDLSTDAHEISSGAFYSADTYPLNTIIIRYTKGIFTLGAMLPSSTPITQGTGYIYVPKALIEQYKVATNWVTYAEQFRAIEDYPEICGGAE